MFSKIYAVCVLPFSLLLGSQSIIVLGDFDLTDIPVDWSVQATDFGIRSISFVNYRDFLQFDYDPQDKLILMNLPCPLDQIHEIEALAEKPIIFLWEPRGIDRSYHALFSKVYTCDDSLVDGEKVFRFYYPYSRPMLSSIPSFNEKKLCSLVTRNWTSERSEMVRFFSGKSLEDFDFYGFYPGDFGDNPRYKGRIPGYHSGDEKSNILKNYRFSICFENVSHIPGYISEKIFACFAAGTVPVYLGPPNIQDYIPSECFINYRDFEDHEQLYLFLKNMPEDTYENYLNNIRLFLDSEKAHLFSIDNFTKILHESIELSTYE